MTSMNQLRNTWKKKPFIHFRFAQGPPLAAHGIFNYHEPFAIGTFFCFFSFSFVILRTECAPTNRTAKKKSFELLRVHRNRKWIEITFYWNIHNVYFCIASPHSMQINRNENLIDHLHCGGIPFPRPNFRLFSTLVFMSAV